jgi:acyl carrier protein
MTDQTTLSPDQARAAVRDAIRKIIPDADFESLGDDAPFRSELELDSLDFLSFVEQLSGATGVRIDEDDYPDLVTMATSVAFLTRPR